MDLPNPGTECSFLSLQVDSLPAEPQGKAPDSSVVKDSACSAGDPGSVPGLGRSSGAGIGYPFQ